MASEPDPLRILQFNSLLKGGGTDDQCSKLASALRQLGQDARVAGPEGREHSAILHKAGVPLHPAPGGSASKMRLVFAAAKLMRREKFHVIHGHHGRDIWPAILAARLSGARPKIVLTRHMAKSPGSWYSRAFVIGQCDALVAVSHFVARVLRDGVYEPDSPEPERRARLPMRGDFSKMHVVHGGIDTERFRPFDAEEQRREWGLEPRHYAFVMAGSYDLPRGKGQREFLAAAARVHGEIPNARFLVIGRGSMENILKADIERLGLADKARMLPYSLEMPRVMNALDCLVHSQVGTEAFGLVVCEAAACGRPVIASALDGIPEAFDAANYGQLVKPESVDELAAAMRQWAAKPPLSNGERSAMHRRMAEEFSLKAFGSRMLGLYRRLTGG